MDDARYTDFPEGIDIPAQVRSEIATFLRMSNRSGVPMRDAAAEIEATLLLKHAMASRSRQ